MYTRRATREELGPKANGPSGKDSENWRSKRGIQLEERWTHHRKDRWQQNSGGRNTRG